MAGAGPLTAGALRVVGTLLTALLTAGVGALFRAGAGVFLEGETLLHVRAAAKLWAGAGELLMARALLASAGALSMMEAASARTAAGMTEALPGTGAGALITPEY